MAHRGRGHSEIFPLVKQGEPNPTKLFQIWLNLPAEDKHAPPHFSMLWSQDILKPHFTDAQGRKTEVSVAAGELDGRKAPPPPPRSWASRPDSDVAIWTVKLEAGATWRLPPAKNPKANRVLYFFQGGTLRLADRDFREHQIVVRIGGIGDLVRGRAGKEGSRRVAAGCHEGCAPCRWRGGAAAPSGTRRPRWPPGGGSGKGVKGLVASRG